MISGLDRLLVKALRRPADWCVSIRYDTVLRDGFPYGYRRLVPHWGFVISGLPDAHRQLQQPLPSVDRNKASSKVIHMSIHRDISDVCLGQPI